ncbi:hypothetical protein FRB96_008462 [Tulasnella sp. 330]|nr:hypothetical protein FRB96_008462 [Tulasnella sp. 330]KAG8883985.1 hypothetical protein FRB97_005429 [Tulasnella sp. 331]KAG8889310.1 hypothetical protein FRB98_004927 [Tulasnella sp. 332]
MAFSRPFTPTNSQSRSGGGGVGTPPDQEMSDQAQPSPRPSLPSSINDFGLVPSSSAPSSPSTTLMALDEPMVSGGASPFASPSSAWNYAFNAGSNAHPLLRKPRRPSMLGLGIMKPAPDTFMTPPNSSGGSTSRMNSPLISSFSSPFAFNAPPLGTYAQSTDRTRRQVQDIEDDYAPELLYASSSNTNETQDDLDSTLSATRTPMRQRVSRSLSPTTPDASRSVNDGDLMSDGLANNLGTRLRRSSGSMLRQASISSSSSGAGLASTSTSSAVPIPNAARRLALPRLQNLIFESDLAETEVKSEAAFQRFVTSHADLPTPFRNYPRTPRSRTSTTGSGPLTALGGRQPATLYPDDRGRFPEEARVEDECAAEDDDDGSSDGFGADDAESAAGATAMSFTEESVMEAGMSGSKLGLSHAGSSGSLGAILDSPGVGMDLDTGIGGPQFSYGNSPISGPNGSNGSLSLNGSGSWRHTPPPSNSSGRVSKRKFDDRYDPYPSAKRRAVSPAVSLSSYQHSHSHGSLASPITLPRSPISIPRQLPPSATSSPIMRPVVRLSERYSISGGGGMMNGSGSSGMMTSGIGLVGMGLGGGVSWSSATGTVSKAEEKEVSGAGDGVGSLTL